MAHNSKKWITTYDGRLKRSNNRTKLDYYGELKWWDSYLEARKVYGRKNRNYKTRSFCPQCKHNFKPIKAHNDLYYGVLAEIKAEWLVLLADKIKKYEKDLKRWQESDFLRVHALCPRNPEYDWESRNAYEKTQAHRIPGLPIIDEETWLCPKCRNKHDTKNAMWSDNMPGRRENWTWGKRKSRRYYRAEVKNIMQKAKYTDDFEGYDEILPRRKEWLD
jgi:hypothetical protein